MWILSAFLLLGMSSVVPLPAADAAEPPPYLQQLLVAHNKERKAEGLPPLTIDPRLTKAAEAHAVDMSGHSVMSHDGSDGSHPADRIAKQKYRYVLVGENVAQGQENVKEVMKAWMNSPGHRKNILGEFKQMGASVYKDEKGSPFWCVDFGSPIPKLVAEDAAKDLIGRINAARETEKKPTLTASDKLNRAARATAEALAQRGTVEAEDVDSGKVTQAEGYRYASLAQSVAAGAPTAESFLVSILKNDDQKAQFLGDFQDVGVGYAQAADETPYWCVLLAKPRRNPR